MRWRHPVKGLLSPAVFVDVLEKAGLIYKIDKYMWEKAAAKLKEWKELGKNSIIYLLIYLQKILSC